MDQDAILFLLLWGVIVASGTFFSILAAVLLTLVLSLALPYLSKFHRKVPQDACVLITGCSTGIGKEACLELTELGITVFAGVRKTEDGVKLKSQAKKSELIIPILLDVTNKEQIEGSYQFIVKYLKDNRLRLFGLINNAGSTQIGPVEFLPLETIRHQFEVNVFGQIAMVQTFLPLLREKNEGHTSRIIFLSSPTSKIPLPFLSLFSSTKSSIESFASCLRQEISQFGVDVSVVISSPVQTNLSFSASNSKLSILSGSNDSIDQAPTVIQEKSQSITTTTTTKNDVNSNANQNSQKYPKNVIEHYSVFSHLINEMMRKSSYIEKSEVVEEILSALFDWKPNIRYFAGMDAKVILRLLMVLPDKFREMLFGLGSMN